MFHWLVDGELWDLLCKDWTDSKRQRRCFKTVKPPAIRLNSVPYHRLLTNIWLREKINMFLKLQIGGGFSCLISKKQCPLHPTHYKYRTKISDSAVVCHMRLSVHKLPLKTSAGDFSYYLLSGWEIINLLYTSCWLKNASLASSKLCSILTLPRCEE